MTLGRESTTEETVPKPKPSASFWSPWWILLFGVYAAALNWWRMGKRRKAIIFLAIYAFWLELRAWSRIDWAMPTDIALTKVMLVILTLALVGFHCLLAELIRRDIRNFKQQGRIPVSTHWTVMFRFFIALVVPLVVLEYGLYILPKDYGYCSFPRFQELVYQDKAANRLGPEKIFLTHNDFGCGWYWWNESTETGKTAGVTQTYVYELNGTYYDSMNPKAFMHMWEYVYVFDRPVTKEQFAAFLARSTWPPLFNDWPLVDVSTEVLSLELSEARCTDLAKGEKYCMVYLANQSLLVRLDFTGSVGPKFDQYMSMGIHKTAERLSQYGQFP